MKANGVSPAYDLIFSTGPGGEHSTTVLGEGKTPTKADIYKVGKKNGIKKKDIGLIVDQVFDAVNNFQTHAKDAGVSKATLKIIQAGIKSNLNRFGLN